jgi:alpha-ketoglutarate-dependent taurine dioxygenase
VIVLHDTEGRGLGALDVAEVQARFREHGWIVFRGFAPDPAALDAFVRAFTATHFLGYGRAPFPELPAITMANESLLALAPHADNGLRPEPQRPDITWFYCETPAETAGETTFFDGIRVWAALAPATQELLLARRFRFVTRYAWRQMRLPDFAAFERFVAAQGGVIRATYPDGSAELEILSPAVRRTRWGDALAFTSSFALAGTPGFEAMKVSLEGSEQLELPAELRGELAAALDACCELWRWEPREVCMLDNTRYLHGRRGFTDARRRMYLVQTLRASF